MNNNPVRFYKLKCIGLFAVLHMDSDQFTNIYILQTAFSDNGAVPL